jgi:hypothetical protein
MLEQCATISYTQKQLGECYPYMTNYTLNYYDDLETEELCFESDNEQLVVEEALSQSSKNEYTYRINKIENDELNHGGQYFRNGKDITQDLIRAIFE